MSFPGHRLRALSPLARLALVERHSTSAGRTASTCRLPRSLVGAHTALVLAALLCSACQPIHMGIDSDYTVAVENCYAYRYGDKLRKINFTQAFDWCHRAAQWGDANSQTLLGELYYLGLGGEQDMRHAEVWFEKAARQGQPHAQYMLYRIHAASNDLARQERADYWLKQARQSGYKLAQPR
ncbi:hypothetical protein MKLM6_3367 [Methylomonas koyamae]|nr:hypothetical protein MKLM6_3367 [Methylomonas koyamae]